MTGWIAETLVATTLLMALVLMVRQRVAELFGARIAYLLWLLPALRMILPPLPDSLGAPPLAHIPAMIDLSVHILPDAGPTEPTFPWGTAVLALWLAGAVVHLGWHMIAYRRFVRDALRERLDLPELDVRGIEVCASKRIEGPFAAGIFVPTIVLPHDYRTRYTPQELRLALRHEVIHHDRGDLPVNLLALTMLSLHWFNPVAYRAWRAFRVDQELACDALVLKDASSDERHSYGLALVKSACKRRPAAACSLNPRHQLKQRLKMMKAYRERRVSGLALAALLLGGGLFATASGGIAAETTREIQREVSEKVIAPAAQAAGMVQAPTAPMPPAPAKAAAPPEPPAPLQPKDPAELWPEAGAGRQQALEAAREAPAEGLAQAEEGRREAQRAVQEAQAEIRQARISPDAMSTAIAPGAFSFVSGQPGQCAGRAGATAVVIRGEAGKSQRAQVLVCDGAMDKTQIVKVTLDAMVTARHQLVHDAKLEAGQRAMALAGMDREIERLKSQMH